MKRISLLKAFAFMVALVVSYKLGNSNNQRIVAPSSKVESVQVSVQEIVKKIVPLEPTVSAITTAKVEKIESFSLPTELNSFEAVSKIIDIFDENIIEEKMLSVFGDTEGVEDKKLFLNKIAEEYFQGESSVDSTIVGDTSAFISYVANKNMDAIDGFQLKEKNSKIRLFAHLELDENYMENLSSVFVKWTNITTGEILLFTRKSINPESQNNWVSFIPSGGWREGDYEVKFFKFSDNFLPLAKVEYTVY